MKSKLSKLAALPLEYIATVLLMLISLHTNAQVRCTLPIYPRTTNAGSITSVVITDPNSAFSTPVYSRTGTVQIVDPIKQIISTGVGFQSGKTYKIEVKLHKPESSHEIGLYIDANNNGNFSELSDGFFLLKLNTTTLQYEANFSYVNSLKLQDFNFIVLSENNPKTPLNKAFVCAGGDYLDGELELYNAPVLNCIKPLPSNFNAGINDTVCIGTTVSFNPTIVGIKVSSLLWTSSDINFKPQSIEDLKITATTTSTYTLNVLDASNGCEYADTKSVLVDLQPSRITLSSKDPDICQGTSTSLNLANVANPGAFNITWLKDGNAKPISTASVNSIIIDQPGKYSVEMVYKKLATCPNAVFKTPLIEVKPGSTPTFEFLSNGTLCSGSTELYVKPSVSTDKLYQFRWFSDYGSGQGGYDNAPNDADLPTYKPSSGASYYVTFRGYNALGAPYKCPATSKVITVAQSPLPPSFKETSVSFCPGGQGSLFAAPAANERLNISGYEWYDAKTNLLVSKINPLVVNKEGSYRAKAISGACASDLSTSIVYASPFYSGSILEKSGDIVLCATSPVELKILYYGESVLRSTDSWHLGSLKNNPIPNANIGVYTTTANYSGKVFVKAKSLEGCDVVDSANIILANNIAPKIIPEGAFCENGYNTLSTNINNAQSYQWAKNGRDLDDGVYSTLWVSEVGDYSVKITLASCTLDASYTIKQFYKNPSKPNFDKLSSNRVVLCSDGDAKTVTATTNDSRNTFEWSIQDNSNDYNLVVSKENVLKITKPDYYYVRAISPEGCSSIDTMVHAYLDTLVKPTIYYNYDGNSPCISSAPLVVQNQFIYGINQAYWYRNDSVVQVLSANMLANGIPGYIPTKPGLHKFAYETKNNCTSQFSNNQIIYALPIADAPSVFNACQYSDALLQPNKYDSKLNYTWSGNTLVTFKDVSFASAAPESASVYINTDNATKMLYILSVTDPLTRCINTDTTTVTITPNNLTLDVNPTAPECQGGLGKLKAITNSTDKNLTFRWISKEKLPYDTLTTKVDSVFRKANVNYTVDVTDSEGCSAVDTVFLPDARGTNLVISTVAIKNPTCSSSTDGVIEVQANNFTGNPSYSWINKTTNISLSSTLPSLSNLRAGSYQLTVKDENGCASQLFSLTDTLKLKPGIISLNKLEYDFGATADTIRNVQSPSGSNTKINIAWEQRDNSTSPWKPLLAKDTLLTYALGQVKSNFEIRRVAKNTCGSVASNTIAISVIVPSARDSVAISGGGELGKGTITLNLFGKAPWGVILNKQVGQTFTEVVINGITITPYVFVPDAVGIYTPKSVNGLTRGSGRAEIFVVQAETTATSAIISGGGVLGSEIKVVIRGRKRYPVTYTYGLFDKQSDNQAKQTFTHTFTTGDTLFKFVPTQVGFYKGISVSDVDQIIGRTFGEAQITPPIVKPTADISGGGIIGSQITVTVNANGTSAPWEVVIEIESVNDTATTFEEITKIINTNPYSFPSSKVGVYRIKSVDGNREGNGEAIVVVEDKDSSSVFVWNAVSPNGDGKNDNFKIEIPKRLSNKKAEIVIFDREGTKLINTNILIGGNLQLNSNENMYVYEWNCKNDLEELLNPGTYFYSFKVEGFEDDKKASKSGYIEVRR